MFEHVRGASSGRDLRLAAFTSATGSAGTIAAGDRLKEEYGTKIVAVEALECPTMLENGFGEHNIQGIGDKHIPLIHNVMNTDVVVRGQRPRDRRARRAVQHRRRPRVPRRSARACRADDRRRAGALRVLVDLQRARRDQDRQAARPRPRRRHHHRRHRRRGAVPERAGQDRSPRDFGGEFTDLDAAEVFGEHLADGRHRPHDRAAPRRDRDRIFNLGYYTWVEQQGTPFELFEARRHQDVLARPASLRRRVGRDDRRLQRPGRGLTDAERPWAEPMRVTGWRCAVCDATVDIATPFPWRCPNATDTDRHHVLTIVNAHPARSSDQSADRPGKRDDSRTDRGAVATGPSSLIAYDHDLAWAAFADANGLDRDARTQLVGAGRRRGPARSPEPASCPTPFGRSDELSDALGFAADGGVWVKDETGEVAGSHKARHLVTILLHLLAAETDRSPADRATAAGDRLVRQRRARRGDARRPPSTGRSTCSCRPG